MKTKNKILLCLLIATFAFFLTTSVLAAPKPTPSPGTPSFSLFGIGKCETAASPIECWLGEVYNWAEMAMLILAPVIIVLAGVIYMTSAGNPTRITLAKKLITGALSGVAVIVLGKFFLTNILGVWWI